MTTARALGRLAAAGLAIAALGASPAMARGEDDPLAPISAQPAAPVVTGSIDKYYSVRREPVWFRPADQGASAAMLLELMSGARLDGLQSSQFVTRRLRAQVKAAMGGDPRAIAQADRALSEAFVNYVAALRGPRAADGWDINDKELKPTVASPAELLSRAAAQPDLDAYILKMGWMQPDYALLRANLQELVPGDLKARLIRLNMQRLRLLPGLDQPGRYIIVNVASQRLSMIEDGKVVDWMRVVVGKPSAPTPMMAAMIRFASLNPYWNLPSDLIPDKIGPNIEKYGQAYMRDKGYVVLSDWGENPSVVDPASVDWASVNARKIEVRIRQNPGPTNAMGRMKFMFPNPAGVYLHDTPDKEKMTEEARLFSAGCVRLSDAPRLGRWLWGQPLKAKGNTPEQRVDLDQPVPVYLSYLTTVPSGMQIVYYEDIYNRDRVAMADGVVPPAPTPVFAAAPAAGGR